MFDPQAQPRVFAASLGQDFSLALYSGLVDRFSAMSPEQIATTEVYVNTQRMARRLAELFHRGPATLLPRIKLVTDLSSLVVDAQIPMAVAPLRRRLEIAQLVQRLLSKDPKLASPESAFDLADSLAALMNEMQGEGVAPEIIRSLNITDQSGHWERALSFIDIVQRLFDDGLPDTEGRQRMIVETLAQKWADTAPAHPVIVAGSTGSRGATSLFMQAVARLPQGAVILPGFDRHMPDDVWNMLDPDKGAEDHPQYRFKAFCAALDLQPNDLPEWSSRPDDNSRTALISLSLRPAPVTHQWIKDGPTLKDLTAATAGMTLIEAPTPRAEADAIAVRLRQAVEDGEVAALISPDRTLTRQVTGALDRWGIRPDDSAGQPLHLSAPGRFLRHVADLFCEQLSAERLLVLLRHPLSASEDGAEGGHGLHTNALELQVRKKGPPFPDRDSILDWARKTETDQKGRYAWAAWVAQSCTGFRDNASAPLATHSAPLATHIERHIAVAEQIARGPNEEGSGGLWQKKAGREALRVMTELQTHAEAGGSMTAREYRRLVGHILSSGEVRDRDEGHPQVLIWGTLEARVQSADLVILAGLNEGTWPEAAAPDPWLNRPLRQQAGLLLPERRIGLSAHDYQQAVCARKVVLSRAIRSDEAETVASRWLNRLTNLLGGLPDQNGPECLAGMRARGNGWIALAAQIATPNQHIPSAPRPSPCPPVAARPDQLSVTQVQTLIRDPYAIYARKILRLNPLDPLAHSANAPLRGIIVHKVMERFINLKIDPAHPQAFSKTMEIADDVLADLCPWPATRTLWRARIAAVLPHFLDQEQARQSTARNLGTELRAEQPLKRAAFTLTGTADRIDLSDDGEALIYDYKTGTPPNAKQQEFFDKQLLLEAAMLEMGAFKEVGPLRTKAAVYIGLGSNPKNVAAPLDKLPPAETWNEFEELIQKWQSPDKGYTSRRAVETTRFEGAYDHLARFGEWDETDDAKPEPLS